MPNVPSKCIRQCSSCCCRIRRWRCQACRLAPFGIGTARACCFNCCEHRSFANSVATHHRCRLAFIKNYAFPTLTRHWSGWRDEIMEVYPHRVNHRVGFRWCALCAIVVVTDPDGSLACYWYRKSLLYLRQQRGSSSWSWEYLGRSVFLPCSFIEATQSPLACHFYLTTGSINDRGTHSKNPRGLHRELQRRLTRAHRARIASNGSYGILAL